MQVCQRYCQSKISKGMSNPLSRCQSHFHINKLQTMKSGNPSSNSRKLKSYEDPNKRLFIDSTKISWGTFKLFKFSLTYVRTLVKEDKTIQDCMS